MPTIFVKKDDRVVVTVYAYDDTDGKTEAVTDKLEVPNTASDIQELEFIFRRPNYSDSYDSLRATGMTGTEMNPSDLNKLSDLVLRTLLTDWNISDGEKKIPFARSGINRLHPAVARSASGGALEKMGI